MKSIPGLCWIIIFCLSCVADKHSGQSQTVPPLPVKHISFDVDSFKVYPISLSPDFSGFLFNPFEDRDKIWIWQGVNKVEMDLLTGLVYPIPAKYPIHNISPPRAVIVWLDSLTGEKFISPFDDNLYYYKEYMDSLITIPLRGVEAIVNTKNTIIAGSDFGLFFINKEDLKISKAQDLPQETYVKEIKVIDYQTLSFNEGRQIYQAPLEGLSKVTQYYNYRGRHQYMIDHEYLSFNLPRGDQSYDLVLNDSLLAIYSNKLLFYFDNNKNIYQVEIPFEGTIIQIQSDFKYWYILYADKFIILKKDYAFVHSFLFNRDQYGQLLDNCAFVINDVWKYSLDEFIDKYSKMVKDPACKNMDRFEENLNFAAQNYFNNYDEVKVNEIESAYTAGEIPIALEKYVVSSLIYYHIHHFNLWSVEKYSKILTEKYPEYDSQISRENIDCYLRIKKTEDSLTALRLPRDEFLFKEAKIKERLPYCGWFGESYYDFSLRDENYDQILKEFPKSQFAEEIEFYRAGFEVIDGETGEPETMEGLIALDQFLKKYPNSKFYGRTELKKAQLMSMYYMNPDSILWYKGKAIEILKNISPKYLQDTTFSKAVSSLKMDLESDILKRAFDFSMTLSDSAFTDDHPISVKIKLTNKTNKSISIHRYISKPYCLIYISPEPDTKFQVANNEPDTDSTEVIIPAGGSIEDNFKLPGAVKKFVYPYGILLGDLSFNKEGTYGIRVFWPNSELSDGLRIHYHH